MTKFGLAQPVRRVEDPRLLKGNGSLHRRHQPARQRCTAWCCAARMRRRRITAIDTAAAKALPGVRAVYTSADLERRRHRRPALRGAA